MAKLKNPLSSLNAQGNLGGILTYQRSRRLNITKKTAKPAQPYTLPQAYHRWHYQDYLAWWSTLSTAEKAVYRARASRTHNTQVGEFLREKLTSLPDLAGGWHFDTISGGKALDFSKNGNHGTVLGPTLTPGHISNALLFDGVDDYVDFGTSPAFDLTATLTLEAFVLYTAPGNYSYILGKDFDPYMLYIDNVNTLRMIITDPDGVELLASANFSAYSNLWTHVLASIDITKDPQIHVYINGSLVATRYNVAITEISSKPLIPLRCGTNWGRTMHGSIDNPILYNRKLSASDALRLSERSYP